MYRSTTQTKRNTAGPVLRPLAVAVRRVLSSQRLASNDARFDAAPVTLDFTAFSPTYKSTDEGVIAEATNSGTKV
jgi:hypothetical protein